VQAARDKLKAALPQDVKVHEDEVKVRRDKKARIKLATPVPLKKVKFEEIKKKPPARDSVCIGDLLNHYGASQQIACTSITQTFPTTWPSNPFCSGFRHD